MSYYIYIHIFLLAIKFTIPNKIIITPIIIYIKLILINFNKMVIKKLNITPNKFKTNWLIDSTVTLDFDEILLCSSDIIMFSKLSEKI